MSITGNIKCFELSKALLKNGATCVASSGEETQDNVIDFNELSRWQSDGSDDTTTETLIITLGEPAIMSRLLVLNHNFKDYTITPITSNFILDHVPEEVLDEIDDEIEDDGSVQQFHNVLSLISSTEAEGISEVDYALGNSYYEFDRVYVSGFTISITKAQEADDVPDQQKFCFRVIPTTEVNGNLGTFESFPRLDEVTDYQSVNSKMLNGRFRVQKLTTVLSAVLSLNNTPFQTDVTLIDHLRIRQEDFILWPCGGKRSPSFYRFNSEPYGVGDIFKVQVNSAVLGSYVRAITSNPLNSSVGIIEVV